MKYGQGSYIVWGIYLIGTTLAQICFPNGAKYTEKFLRKNLNSNEFGKLSQNMFVGVFGYLKTKQFFRKKRGIPGKQKSNPFPY